MPDLEVTIRVVCAKCGAELDAEPPRRQDPAKPEIEVQPCDACTEKAEEKAREEGETAGRIDGREEAKREAEAETEEP